jgi:hypothetical protein
LAQFAFGELIKSGILAKGDADRLLLNVSRRRSAQRLAGVDPKPIVASA